MNNLPCTKRYTGISSINVILIIFSDKPKGIIQPISIEKASTLPKPNCLEEEAVYFPHSMVRFSLGRYQLGINFNDPLILLN